jgi:hypothetical protein
LQNLPALCEKNGPAGECSLELPMINNVSARNLTSRSRVESRNRKRR